MFPLRSEIIFATQEWCVSTALTRMTLTGRVSPLQKVHILVPFYVSTPTGSLEFFKLMINSVFSRQNAQFAAFDIKNFYLDTPMENPEYVRVKLEDIPQEFID